ncbi:hypothetical protein KIPB_007141, partial [Kipferlia bialata]
EMAKKGLGSLNLSSLAEGGMNGRGGMNMGGRAAGGRISSLSTKGANGAVAAQPALPLGGAPDVGLLKAKRVQQFLKLRVELRRVLFLLWDKCAQHVMRHESEFTHEIGVPVQYSREGGLMLEAKSYQDGQQQRELMDRERQLQMHALATGIEREKETGLGLEEEGAGEAEAEDEDAPTTLAEATSTHLFHLWVNTTKNPRYRDVDFSPTISVTVPQVLALSNSAVRVVIYDTFPDLSCCVDVPALDLDPTVPVLVPHGLCGQLSVLRVPEPADEAKGWAISVVDGTLLSLSLSLSPSTPLLSDEAKGWAISVVDGTSELAEHVAYPSSAGAKATQYPGALHTQGPPPDLSTPEGVLLAARGTVAPIPVVEAPNRRDRRKERKDRKKEKKEDKDEDSDAPPASASGSVYSALGSAVGSGGAMNKHFTVTVTVPESVYVPKVMLAPDAANATQSYKAGTDRASIRDGLMVAAWNERLNSWDPELIIQCDWEPTTRELTFSTGTTGMFALVTSRGRCLPYKHWSLTPLKSHPLADTLPESVAKVIQERSTLKAEEGAEPTTLVSCVVVSLETAEGVGVRVLVAPEGYTILHCVTNARDMPADPRDLGDGGVFSPCFAKLKRRLFSDAASMLLELEGSGIFLLHTTDMDAALLGLAARSARTGKAYAQEAALCACVCDISRPGCRPLVSEVSSSAWARHIPTTLPRAVEADDPWKDVNAVFDETSKRTSVR